MQTPPANKAFDVDQVTGSDLAQIGRLKEQWRPCWGECPTTEYLAHVLAATRQGRSFRDEYGEWCRNAYGSVILLPDERRPR